MAEDISRAVREVCLSFPEAEEFSSHGSPNFRVRGKTFATYVINHHGDGRVALWLNSPPGAQQLYTQAEPQYFFVPPYVGPRGWLGVLLDRGVAWKQIARLVREAYEKVAPAGLSATLGGTIDIIAPRKSLSASEIDPLLSRRAQTVLKRFRSLCLALPETSQAQQFGMPVWRAGRRTFAWMSASQHRVTLSFWAGADRQSMLCREPRFHLPAYLGHNGWIALDVTEDCNWDEVLELAQYSYRHFALKRMISQLPL